VRGIVGGGDGCTPGKLRGLGTGGGCHESNIEKKKQVNFLSQQKNNS